MRMHFEPIVEWAFYSIAVEFLEEFVVGAVLKALEKSSMAMSTCLQSKEVRKSWVVVSSWVSLK